MVLPGQVFQANVNGQTKSIVETDPRQKGLLEVQTSQQVVHLVAALEELRSATLLVIKISSCIVMVDFDTLKSRISTFNKKN